MKKTSLQIFIVLIFLLTACGRTPIQTQVTLAPVSNSLTATPTFLPTSTQTFLPSATSTASITPLPTIPTFTPTFDASTIVTVTPAPKAECSIPNQSIKIEIPELTNFSPVSLSAWSEELNQKILSYLNLGGQIQNLTLAYTQRDILNFYGGFLPISIDLTGDSVDEIVVFNPVNNVNKISPTISVFSCQNGQYANLFTFQQPDSTEKFQNLFIKDINANNVPELLIQLGHVYPENSSKVWIYEYQNNSFESLLSIPYDNINNHVFFNSFPSFPETITYRDYLLAFGEYDFETHDVDNSPLQELVLEWNFDYSNDASRRVKTIYSWDGNNFTYHRALYSEPKYRFQAIQDADSYSIYGEFDEAFPLYQETIFSEQLLPWTPEVANPAEDTSLAAYAYYRIMLLHLVQNHESDATIIYNTLQEKIGSDQYARPYVEMATAFWDAYQSTQKMYDGCAAAIQYAATHPEILIPLGSDYHGWQSHTYVPADVCPFR